MAKSPSEPFFTVTQSHGPIVGFEREQFAVYRVKDLGKVRGTSIVSKTRVNIDGLRGFEIVAKGEDVRISTPLMVYEMILFRKDDHYYLMVGGVGSSPADPFAYRGIPPASGKKRSHRRRGKVPRGWA